jgi:hypothetical protein
MAWGSCLRFCTSATVGTLVLLFLPVVVASPVNLFDANANKFGMGVYNDTAAPGLDEQLPETKALVGDGGYALLYFNLHFARTGDSTSCTNGCQPASWALDAVKQAYELGLKPIVRVGQWSRHIRKFSDDTRHRNYTSLAQAYKKFLAVIPRPPDGSALLVQLLNEPNECGEWPCDDGAGIYLDAKTMAAEAASCLRDLHTAVRTLPLVAVGLAPIAYAAPTRCECAVPSHNPKVNFSEPNDINYIAAMRAEVPDLWAKADYFSAHTYPFHGQPFASPLGRAGIENYRAQLKAIGRASSASFPVAISETGWFGTDEQMKATNIVAAYREVYVPDPTVFAVMPFLLTTYRTSPLATPERMWVSFAPNGTKTRFAQWEATYKLRCSLGLGGVCSHHDTA